MSEQSRVRIGADFYLLTLLMVPVTYLLHELGHWGAGEMLGVDMWMTLNKAGPVDRSYPSEEISILVSLAGPAVTVAIGIFAYFYAIMFRSVVAYGILYIQFLLRGLAGGISLLGEHPNDEAAAGLALGIGIYPITLGVVGFLFILLWDAARRLRPGFAHNLGAYVLINAVITAIVFSDGALRAADIRLL
ncbi:hypothetical protein [Maricaulis sp.]|uniref:hypothetical protein n=1 Tax=Maricaulis sp. TaxID=1486257 RepID=UPI001B01FD75|nr:hypothetical protein [Maricaulis sp.]MBO6797296.1 hypothetical protein [Maricaulis sp.]